jgi:MerR family mercuric resistance operon transcriptional regulator
MAPETRLTIGKLAARAGLTPDAVRYYERLGVVPRPGRTVGGFRVYSAEVIERLRFIKQAQLHGLTLAEIRELLSLNDRRGVGQCRQVQRLLTRKLAELDQRVAQLQEFRRTLGGYLAQCDRALSEAPDGTCPVVDHLGRPRTADHA